MKALQKPHPQRPKPAADEQKIGLDDRIGAAGAACFFGAPTAFLTWLLAMAAGTEMHLALPPHHLGLGVWAVLVVCGFLFPRSMDEIFSAIWTRLGEGLRIVLAFLIPY